MKLKIAISFLFILALSLIFVSANAVTFIHNDSAPCGVDGNGNACACISQPLGIDGCTYNPVYNNGCLVSYNSTCNSIKCANEGEYTSGAVSPEYAFSCCAGLQGFNTRPGLDGFGVLCYNPEKYTPVCKFQGIKSEGWYYSSGKLLRYETCSNYEPSCVTKDSSCCKGDLCVNSAVNCGNSTPQFLGCDSNCTPQWVCKETIHCSSQVCEDGSIAPCYADSSGMCSCSTCPPIIITPVCGNGVCESGEGLICATPMIACEAGKECSVSPAKCVYGCEQDCKGLPGIDAKLNEYFKLEISQFAKVLDFPGSPLKVTFRDLITANCAQSETSTSQVSERLKSSPVASEASASAGGGSGASADVSSGTKTSIIKCPAVGPMAQLEIEMPKENGKKIVTLKLTEAKEIYGATISFYSYDFASRTGAFIVNSATSTCPVNCKCDENGKILDCHSIPMCSVGMQLCPDGICRETCTNSTTTNCDYGCLYNNKCLTIGTRASGLFCSLDGTMTNQGSDKCENNFECKSNVCIDSKCISSSLIQKFFDWFKKLFGGDKPVDVSYCKTNQDCAINYNILSNDQCSAGCFNKNTKPDTSCDLKWELIVSSCSCINNKCELTSYSCPQESYINCMPHASEDSEEIRATDKYCETNYRNWISTNCNVTFAD